ncbi:MAG: helix-turn-helix transcriptional regulator, partial [Treponema sp.]|nr:helix-turn-helix transcriptional regulator [Treponema sp.]
KRRGFYRLLVDEGNALLPVLVAYVKEKGETPYLMNLAEEMRNMAALYPLYLKPLHKNGLVFSQMEVNILRFMDQGKTKEEIAGMYFFSVDAVSFHLKNIYKKLEVTSAIPALFEARVLGLI